MPASRKASFDPTAFLSKVGEGRRQIKHRKGQVLFSQGARGGGVLYPARQGKVHRHIVARQGSRFASMLSPPGKPEQLIVVEGAELMLPADIGIPMGFVVSELITNAAKHGKGRISVRLEKTSGKGHALSVCNDGSALPDGFDPVASRGLGA